MTVKMKLNGERILFAFNQYELEDFGMTRCFAGGKKAESEKQ